MKRKSGERVALEIVASKDFNHAFEIVTAGPRKTMKHHMVEEPEGMDGFLYDTRNELTRLINQVIKLRTNIPRS